MVALNHLTGLKNLNRKDIEDILNIAEGLEDICTGKEVSRLLEDKLMVTLFYEPSTRTRLSFESAMNRLGGRVVSVADARGTSSAWKGETLPDAMRTIDNYADVIVLRHSEAGAAEEAASYSRVPLLNAGDGTNEHPSQGLLDLLTIRKERGTLDGLKVTLVGDLKHTRSTNSLTLGLSNFDVELTFVSPPDFAPSPWLIERVKERNLPFALTEDLGEAVRDADVVYVCRIQKERLADPDDYKKIEGAYVLNRSTLEKASQVVTVMHHLPRVGELSEDVDDYPGAAYFRQPLNGVLVRAAVLTVIFDRIPG